MEVPLKVLSMLGHRQTSGFRLVCRLFLVWFAACPLRAAEWQTLPDRLPAAARAVPAGRLDPTNRLKLAMALPLRNQGALTELLRQIQDPASPNFHHYLTPAEFAARFGPTEADYRAVRVFAETHGLRVTATHPNRLLLDVSGSVAEVERALHVTMHTYEHPTEHRTFFAPDTAPSLDLATPVLGISGLDNFALPRPRFFRGDGAKGLATPNAGSGPSGNYMGLDFRAAYAPDTALAGTGQAVGLLEFDGYTAADITYYEGKAGLPVIPLQNVLIDGASGLPSHEGGEIEVSLDIEMAISMATNLAQVIVYETANDGSWHDMLNRMASDNLARQLSCSWYIPGGVADPVADGIFQEMAAQGQTFFAACGDDDAYTGLIPFPGDTPYVTEVGGTTLTTTGPAGAYTGESVWNWGNGQGTGGGISTQYPIPSWQTNISMAANQGSTTKRNIPDVALTANQIYVRADGEDLVNYGGTSFAAPLWAGFTALVNQQAAASGKAPVGFINPALDTIGKSAAYPSCFHDITTGNNESGSSPAKFSAVMGFDLCTGWGTPAGQNLINALANPEPLVIAPLTGFTASGGAGGPFTLTSQNFSLTNIGTNSLTWALVNTCAWLTASSPGGTLAAQGGSAAETVSLTAAASNLVVGTYGATIWFTNLSDHIGQGRSFSLAIIQPPVITTEPTNTAVLEGAAAAFTVTAAGGQPLAWQWQENGTNLVDGGNISGSTTTNLLINRVFAAAVGTFTVVVTNSASAVTSSPAILSLIPSMPVITEEPASQVAVAGETAVFSVAAIGSQPFAYQWTFDGTNLVDATNETLTLAELQLNQAGAYAVVLTNEYGGATSSVATLTVYTVPVINALSPAAGPAGTVVNIMGANFSPIAASNTVYFGAVQATVTAASATNLVASAPMGATLAPVTETVNGLTADSFTPFLPAFPGSGPITNTSLGARLDLPTGTSPGEVVIADLDGDGKPDVVVATGSHNVYVYRNISTNGTLSAGSFAPPVIFPLDGGYFGALLAVDLTGDGKLDLVTVDFQNSEVVLLKNLSTPGVINTNSFGAPVIFPSGPEATGIAAGDIDGDGRPELVTADYGSTNVSVFLNRSTPGVLTTNSFAPAVHFLAGQAPKNVVITDLDGDGKPDVVTANNGGTGAMSVLRNISTPGNIAFDTNVVFTGLSGSYSIAVGDLDGDGKPDVVVGAQSGGAISLYRNTSTPGSISTNSFAPAVDFPVGGWANWVALGDVAGDGKLDVVVVGQMPDQLLVYQNTSTPGSITSASLAAPVQFATGSNPIGVAIGDLDGDGRPDIFFSDTYSGTVSIFQNVAPFGGPPEITLQPASQSVVSGHTATLTVAATGTAPLSYQWSFNDEALGGATNATLVLTNVQTSEAGEYDVEVTNSLGTDLSSNAWLTVEQAPPTIVDEPVSLTNVAGSTAVFAVTATGSLPMSYQWQENGTNLTDGGIISGSATAVLTLSGVQDADAASYTVAITNVAGSITSSVASLVVLDPPVILTQPTNEAVTAGGTAVFSVTVGGPPPLTYQWLKNGAALTDGGAVSGSATPSLTLAGVGSGDAASYSVVVTNLAGSATSVVASLTVLAPPAITTEPASITNYAGTAAIFTVSASGTAPLSYQWEFNGTNLAGATNAMLVLVNVQPAQAGNYAALVTNNYGAVLSSNALLTVIPAPTNTPVISGFSPAAGPPGTVVTVTGANFNPVAAGNTVYFGAVRSAVTAASATNLTVTVPLGATFAPVTETTGGLTGVSPAAFVPTFPATGVFTNTSLGTQLELTAGSGPGTVLVADVDGDGKPDLVAGMSDHNLYVYRNLGASGPLATNNFAAPVLLPLGTGYHSQIQAADLTGDGRLDLVAVDFQNSAVIVVKNLSAPGSLTTNSFSPAVAFPCGKSATGVAVGDLDGDGKPELVTANYGTTTVSVLRNQCSPGVISTNSFAVATNFIAGVEPKTVAIADIDGDGRLDVITANNGGTGAMSVLRNLSTLGNIALATGVVFTGLSGSYSVAVGDLDGDGKPDVVVGVQNSEMVSVFHNTSTPGGITTNSFGPRVDFAAGGWANWVAIGDLDGDGKPDLAVAVQQPSKMEVFRNQSAPGSFTTSSLSAPVVFASYGSGSNPNYIAIGDFNGDGRSDIVFPNANNANVSLYQNVIPARPFILAQPVGATNVLLTTATFSVTAAGPTPLAYQWDFNGTNLAGATNATLALTNVQWSQAGEYVVLVTNTYGSILSSNALLVVNPLYHFSWNPIPSPRFVNVPFAIVVQAQNATNGPALNFTNTVSLGSTNGMPIAPAVSANFIQGVWTGAVTVAETSTNLVLTATDSLGDTGLANPINIVNLPALTTTTEGGSLLVLWPVNPAGFSLETSPQLFPAAWTPVSTPPFQIGDQYLVTVPTTGTNAFYRLVFPGP